MNEASFKSNVVDTNQANTNTVEAIPLLLVVGPLGAGKTTLMRRLLAHKPPSAHWGVLVNDFGTMALDAQALSTQGVQVASLSGGCVCCTLQASITQALERLVSSGVEQILLEPSGVADTRALYLALRKLSFIRLLSVLAVIPASALLAERKSPVVRAQLAMAERVWVSHSDKLQPAQQQMIADRLGALYPAKVDWQCELSDIIVISWFASLFNHPVSSELTAPQKQPMVISEQRVEESHRHEGIQQFGWRFPLNQHWSRPCLQKQLSQLTMYSVLRVKALLRTGTSHWVQLDWTAYSGWVWQESDYAGDSRFEVIASASEIDWLQLLTQCIHR